MPIISAQQLGKSFGAERVFKGLTFQVDPGVRIGLVGPNGAGKSTLLKIIAGTETADEGTLSVQRGVRIGYLSQIPAFDAKRTLRGEMEAVFTQLHAWEAEMQELSLAMASLEQNNAHYQATLNYYAELQEKYEHADGYTYENRIDQVLSGLHFTTEQQNSPATQLSGGQQTRAALAHLLLQQPDLLLLDEPTNHLDLEVLEWLETYLVSWKGALLVIAHDRYFLDKVVTCIFDLRFGRLEEYPGNYTTFLKLRQERIERRLIEWQEQQEHIQRTEEFIRKYKAGQRSKEARGRQKILDRLERLEKPLEEQKLKLKLASNFTSSQVVLTLQKLVVGYGRNEIGEAIEPNLLLACPEVDITRGERIGLLGPNGSGKTTLLRTLVGQLAPLSGRIIIGKNVHIGYYAQSHEGLDENKTVLDELLGSGYIHNQESARTFLGRFLFSGDDVFKPVSALSGGERSRVALAKLMLMGANFLVLDEPTNHLDLPSRQLLEEVLRDYDGTLLFVSHDRYFIDALATRLFVVKSGSFISSLGNYSDYHNREVTTAASLLLAHESVSPPSHSRPKFTSVTRNDGKPGEPSSGNGESLLAIKVVEKSRRGSGKPGKGKGQPSLEQVENDIARIEAEIATLENELNLAGAAGAIDRITALTLSYQKAIDSLEDLYSMWALLAENVGQN